MLIQEMTEQECRKHLQKLDYGRLACVRDNQPYIVPVYFAFDEQHLYGITTPGQKIAWMRTNPLICLQVDERSSHNQWLSIVVFGRYEELPDTPEYGRARTKAMELLQKRTMWWEPACVSTPRHERRPALFYRIQIGQVTGRRAVPAATGPSTDPSSV